MTEPANAEALEFAAAFRRFLEWVHSSAGGAPGEEVTTLVRDTIGPADLLEPALAARPGRWSGPTA